jgi:hypothetical protein
MRQFSLGEFRTQVLKAAESSCDCATTRWQGQGATFTHQSCIPATMRCTVRNGAAHIIVPVAPDLLNSGIRLDRERRERQHARPEYDAAHSHIDERGDLVHGVRVSLLGRSMTVCVAVDTPPLLSSDEETAHIGRTPGADQANSLAGNYIRQDCGERGIRTPKSLRTPVFKTGAIAVLPALQYRCNS